MRILHTGDWHAGRTLQRRQRLEELATVLDEIVAIAAEERVDVVLVCGDIFDHFAPSAEAERIVYDALLRLRGTGASVLVIPGNHDNAKRLGAVEELLRAAGVEAVPDVRRPDQGGLVEVHAQDGDEVAQVAALPWVPERLLFGVTEMMDLEAAPQQAYAEQLPRILDALCAPFEPGKVHVLAGHLFVSGARVGGGERELTIGQLFAISAATLPTSPQYIALGHVHRPQAVPGSPVPARYAGSLLQLDFGERDQVKSVTIVEVEPGRPATTRERPITGGRKLLDVRGTLDYLRAAAVEPDAFLRVILVCDGPSPGLADEVREFLPNAVEVRLEYEREDADQRAAELRRMTPRELFARYHRERHGADADDRLMRLFDDLLEEVTGAPAAA